MNAKRAPAQPSREAGASREAAATREGVDDRTVSAARGEEDAGEASLRPQTLAEFTGQRASHERLEEDAVVRELAW